MRQLNEKVLPGWMLWEDVPTDAEIAASKGASWLAVYETTSVFGVKKVQVQTYGDDPAESAYFRAHQHAVWMMIPAGCF